MVNEPLPAFCFTKDMFEVIDIRGDGVVEEKEWVQTFGQLDWPETIIKEQGSKALQVPRQLSHLAAASK
jgi:hypothetical protein